MLFDRKMRLCFLRTSSSAAPIMVRRAGLVGQGAGDDEAADSWAWVVGSRSVLSLMASENMVWMVGLVVAGLMLDWNMGCGM